MALQSIDKKMALADRGLGGMVAAVPAEDDDAFEYHFTAFLANARAAAEYIRNDAASHGAGPWWRAKEDDLDIASVIGLRNADIHHSTIQRNRHYDVRLQTTLPPVSDSAVVGPANLFQKIIEAIKNISAILPRYRHTRPEPVADTSSVTMTYVIRKANLDPATFMVDPRFGPNRNKARVEGYLPDRDLVLVCRQFMNKSRAAILEGETNGHLTK